MLPRSIPAIASSDECIHGGCFQISTGFNCQDCSEYCDAQCGGISGSSNLVCFNETETDCNVNTDCPLGQACSPGDDVSDGKCMTPC